MFLAINFKKMTIKKFDEISMIYESFLSEL